MVISYGEIEAHMDELSLLQFLLLEGNKNCQSRANMSELGMFAFQTRPLLNMFPATCCFSFPRVGQE